MLFEQLLNELFLLNHRDYSRFYVKHNYFFVRVNANKETSIAYNWVGKVDEIKTLFGKNFCPQSFFANKKFGKTLAEIKLKFSEGRKIVVANLFFNDLEKFLLVDFCKG